MHVYDIYIYIYVYIYTYVCIHIYVYTYIYIYNDNVRRDSLRLRSVKPAHSMYACMYA